MDKPNLEELVNNAITQKPKKSPHAKTKDEWTTLATRIETTVAKDVNDFLAFIQDTPLQVKKWVFIQQALINYLEQGKAELVKQGLLKPGQEIPKRATYAIPSGRTPTF